ncbi:MAG: HlyD family efflux transporter periplasmic adaptor subunit [Burkholderiales bacterium]|nr:HlyD family efflux transporter periplasmic adaptor subunit [Burkholderiales bacterium]
MSKSLLILICSTLLSACNQQTHSYNGYIDADLTYLSSDSGGRLSALAVTRGDTVNINQFLFRLDQGYESYGMQANLQQQNNLNASLAALRAQISYAKSHYQRQLQMQPQAAASTEDVEQARQNLEVLQNQLQGLKAQLAAAQNDTAQKNWQISHKENFALESAIVFDSYFTKGEYVPAGQPVVSLLSSNNIKAIFFIGETGLGKIHLGEKIKLTRDGSNDSTLGHISYIAKRAEYTPPIIFSRENRQKLVFKVEVRLDNPDLNSVHLGQPVSLELLP